ncbi:hypothetical protein MRB53_023143 [Persea americana]|uniref:Uncharacterized protein n=1 Tax=Persea americana TaxID=3435 RepID=A0ACC2L8R0_PERAE|nr:hypothetical protein MRB53_023143 [Persea americana]
MGLLLRASVPESGGEGEGDEAEDGVWEGRGEYLCRGRGRDAVEDEDGRRRIAVAVRLLWVGVLLRRDRASVGLLLRASVPESGGEVEGDEAEDGVWEGRDDGMESKMGCGVREMEMGAWGLRPDLDEMEMVVKMVEVGDGGL